MTTENHNCGRAQHDRVESTVTAPSVQVVAASATRDCFGFRTRRDWLIGVPAATLLAGSSVVVGEDRQAASADARSLHAEFPSHDPAVVRDIVAASHADIDSVRSLVEASPALAKAAWDWGFGDWESALGAASHMGRRDIAELLIANGARPNLFTFAMLGQLVVVQALVKANPGIQRNPGPHGITLLQHARNGGAPAGNVTQYLDSLGDADIGATSLEVSDEQKQRYVGRYVINGGEDGTFEVLVNRRGGLGIKRGNRFPRTLHRVEEHGFAPAGAPAVRVRFDVENGRAVALTIHDPHPLVRASRTKP